MKKFKVTIRTGIWINSKAAYVVQIREGEVMVQKINSGIRSRIREAGEGKPFTQFQRTYANAEAQHQAKEAQLKKQFFTKVLDALHDSDYIYISGPGIIKKELHNLIIANQTLHDKFVGLEATEELGKKEIIRQVKNYFDSEKFWAKPGISHPLSGH